MLVKGATGGIAIFNKISLSLEKFHLSIITVTRDPDFSVNPNYDDTGGIMCHLVAKFTSNYLIAIINSLWPIDTIWRHISVSTLAQVMACCVTAPSHYLNQCSLPILEVLQQSPERNITASAWANILYNEFELTMDRTHNRQRIRIYACVLRSRGIWRNGACNRLTFN